MPTKKAKKKSTLDLHEPNIKAVIAFFILLLALGVFLIFNTYQEGILSSSSLKYFLILTVVLFSLLVGLLFLINPQKSKR